MKKIYENELSYIVRGVIYDVYKDLGPGLLEAIYVRALCKEFREIGLKYQTQVDIPVIYKGDDLGIGYRMDIPVENTLILEIKSLEKIAEVHHKQLITYIKLYKVKIGLLVNFGSNDITQSIYRKVNGLQD